MKYKLLLAGKNNVIIDDFFLALSDAFECVTTSLRPRDVFLHLQMFQPDAFVYCMAVGRNENMVHLISELKTVKQSQNNLILIGDSEACKSLLSKEPRLADLVLTKPISSQNIQKEIVKYLDKQEKRPEEKAFEESAEVVTPTPIPTPISEPISTSTSTQILQENIYKILEEEGTQKRILVIDDDPLMLRVIKEALKKDYNIATAVSGRVGLNFLQRKKVDLILLDYEMPDEDGAEVMRKLRANDVTRNIPVIFLTGINDRNKIQKVLAMKPQGYLLKPIDHEKLSQVIKQTIG